MNIISQTIPNLFSFSIWQVWSEYENFEAPIFLTNFSEITLLVYVITWFRVKFGWNNLQFVVFEKFTRIYWHQIARKIMLLLFNTVHGKKRRKSRATKFWKRARALLVIFTRVTTLQSCYNFAGVLHENAIVFGKSVRNFFLRIINSIKRRGVYFIFRDSKSQILYH